MQMKHRLWSLKMDVKACTRITCGCTAAGLCAKQIRQSSMIIRRQGKLMHHMNFFPILTASWYVTDIRSIILSKTVKILISKLPAAGHMQEDHLHKFTRVLAKKKLPEQLPQKH